jgi:hypothetical protein
MLVECDLRPQKPVATLAAETVGIRASTHSEERTDTSPSLSGETAGAVADGSTSMLELDGWLKASTKGSVIVEVVEELERLRRSSRIGFVRFRGFKGAPFSFTGIDV